MTDSVTESPCAQVARYGTYCQPFGSAAGFHCIIAVSAFGVLATTKRGMGSKSSSKAVFPCAGFSSSRAEMLSPPAGGHIGGYAS